MSQCEFALLGGSWLVRSVDEGPGDGHLRAVCLGLANGVPRANGEVERVGVVLACRALVLDGRNDTLAVIRVCDAHLAATELGVVALCLCG